jgi:hypothetical protein
LKANHLTVKSVVDTVNDVFRGGCIYSESALVLLDNFLLAGGKSGNIVNFTDCLVWSVAHNLSCSTGVHALKTKVGTDIGVVKIDNLTSSKLSNGFVVNNGVGSGGDDGSTEGGSGTKESTTVSFGVEGG